VNAYFTYSVVGFRGTGSITYESAVTAVLIEGIIFLFLALSGARYALVKLIPEPVRLATPAAIGAFLAHLGLQTAEGIGVVVSDSTFCYYVVFVGCVSRNQRLTVSFLSFVAFDSCYSCDARCMPAQQTHSPGGLDSSVRGEFGLLCH
jgi:xanthine/uracil/vitamin C permease (AzgA family)